MHPNSVKWVDHEYPLISLGYTRKMCQDYLLSKFGFIPPRSGCTICKYFDEKQKYLLNGYTKKNSSIDKFILEEVSENSS